MRAAVVGPVNGVGLSRDRVIVEHALLDQGFEMVAGQEPADLQIFLEVPVPTRFHLAKHNVIIPNPEWWLPEWTPLVQRSGDLDVLVKTRHAEMVFRDVIEDCRLHYVGFASFDRFGPTIRRRRQFIHIAGKSDRKNTELVLTVWERHPDWPRLIVVANPGYQPVPGLGANIAYTDGAIDDSTLHRLQNESLFHLCPSSYEGFGHAIWEGLSTCNIVLTTNYGPMWDAVIDDAGVAIPFHGVTRRPGCLVDDAVIKPEALEVTVEDALQLSDLDVQAVGQAARKRWQAGYAHFHSAFASTIRAIVGTVAGTSAGAGEVQ